ncbi:hypothetical protein TWF970_004228 [Orbilia oligospora]|uniref:Uncharacterized protein n=1 Tax=Orbilia oligospora TaxID=2813651 RepID=A0A7C8VEW9_ORBOL|nr:hypothetical protein TWF970_004228 [Orbilia oligospora]
MCTRKIKRCFQCKYFGVVDVKHCPGRDAGLFGACIGWLAERTWYIECPACCRSGSPSENHLLADTDQPEVIDSGSGEMSYHDSGSDDLDLRSGEATTEWTPLD